MNYVPRMNRRSFVVGGAALVKEKPRPTDAEIDAAITNICRCGTFQRVRAAIHAIANA